MAYNEYIVGQPITLSDSVTNALGVLTDDSSEAITVYRRSDNQTFTPSVTHGTTGLYSAVFTPDQEGWYEYVFTSTGAASGRGRGRFYVQPVP